MLLKAAFLQMGQRVTSFVSVAFAWMQPAGDNWFRVGWERAAAHRQGEGGETEARASGCAGILWIHRFWKTQVLLLQWQVLSLSLSICDV